MAGKYASKTSVSVEKTKAEIERILDRWGADGFSYQRKKSLIQIAFIVEGKTIRLDMELPDKNEKQFSLTPAGRRRRTAEGIEKEWEQACRAHWRSLSNFIKATLEAVEIGIISFDQAFLPYIVMNDGRTVTETVGPHIINGSLTKMLPPMPEADNV